MGGDESEMSSLSVDLLENAFSTVSEVGHKHLNTLRVDVVRACGVVCVLDVGHLVSQALSVKSIFSIVSLMLDHVEGDHDLLEARLLALGVRPSVLLVAHVEALLVLGLGHSFRCVLDCLELALVKCFLHSY